jgi:hypothetical protein
MTFRDIEIDILRKYFQVLVSADPLSRQIGSVKTLHAGGFRYEEKNKELVTPLHKLSFTIEISIRAIKEFDLEEMGKQIYDFSQQQIEKFHKMMFETLDKVTELTGNQVSAEGKPPSPDLILDMLEKVEIRFDNEGKPILPTLVVAPETGKKLAEVKFTPEQEERQRQIIEKKKNEFYAKKRYRGLSYID